MLFEFFGGLGIFLFGLNFMGDGLQQSAGDNLRSILNTFTSTPFRSIIAGAAVTVLIQSSSGTTVLTVGLVSAGFMTLKQAIGVVMGANIGTTITAFIIGFDIGAYALPIMAIGSFIIFFSKKDFIMNVGKIVFGFGALFLGLELMGDGMAPLQDLQQFRNLMLTFSDNPLLGVSAGTLMTLVVQSSSATIGILQEMYSNGALELDAALPILFGGNIGTTITAILAAFGASIVAKRTAASHVIFNLAGTVVILLFLSPFTSIVLFLSESLQLSPPMQIAFAHGLFNVVNVLIQMWFISQIASLVTRIIPGEVDTLSYDDSRLEPSLIQTSPSIALNQVKIEIEHMGEIVMREVEIIRNYFKSRDEKDFDRALEHEEIINEIDSKLTDYLMLISREELQMKNSNDHRIMLEITKYLERIGDHGENILHQIKEGNNISRRTTKKGETFVGLYDEDVGEMYKLIEENISDVLDAFITNNHKLANEVLVREEKINALETHLRGKYIERINEGKVRPSDGIMFVDIVSNLERMSDHTVKIAKLVLDNPYPLKSSNTFKEEVVN